MAPVGEEHEPGALMAYEEDELLVDEEGALPESADANTSGGASEQQQQHRQGDVRPSPPPGGRCVVLEVQSLLLAWHEGLLAWHEGLLAWHEGKGVCFSTCLTASLHPCSSPICEEIREVLHAADAFLRRAKFPRQLCR